MGLGSKRVCIQSTERSDLCFACVPKVAISLAAAAAWALFEPTGLALALEKLEFPPVKNVTYPSYTKHKLNNGLVVYLMEDHEVPLVGGTITFRGGSRSEPEGKTGLAAITASVLRSGGTEELSGYQLDDFLAERAAFVGASANPSSFSVAFSCLSEDLESVLPTYQRMIRTPLFPEEKLALAKSQAFGGIARRNDDPNEIARREIVKLVYGPNSKYARSMEYSTVSSIRRSDLQGFYLERAVPNNATIAIVGNFKSDDVLKLVEQYFGEDWAPTEKNPKFEVPEVDKDRLGSLRGTVFIADKKELSQSYVRAAILGGRLDDPDYFALEVINQLLNGLGGRLFNEVRSKQGLAYSVFGQWYPAYDHPGIFLAGGETSSADGKQLVDFLSKLVDTLKDLDVTEISDKDLTYAKDSTLNSFVFNFTSPEEVLGRIIKYEFYGYPPDFAEKYLSGIRGVTPQAVLQASSYRIREDDLIYLIVANQSKVEPALKAAGYNVVPCDIKIPPPPGGLVTSS
uniref:Peptidase M16 C-terminal domain-containing protein n=1 Tax=Rhodosorus marinus TaxID=101924 RepID=A0A7S2Z8W1_9RHOD|mmetsp:Transcript_10139/g.42548  ORF Transcript_10139/g.42548 Transcript_10139/m.42548 type:complete len:514 (+) Transcript_10139:312-1853(+)